VKYAVIVYRVSHYFEPRVNQVHQLQPLEEWGYADSTYRKFRTFIEYRELQAYDVTPSMTIYISAFNYDFTKLSRRAVEVLIEAMYTAISGDCVAVAVYVIPKIFLKQLEKISNDVPFEMFWNLVDFYADVFEKYRVLFLQYIDEDLWVKSAKAIWERAPPTTAYLEIFGRRVQDYEDMLMLIDDSLPFKEYIPEKDLKYFKKVLIKLT